MYHFGQFSVKVYIFLNHKTLKMKTLSLVPILALGGLITFLAVFSPISKMVNSDAAIEMTAEMKSKKFKEFLANFQEMALPYEVNQDNFADYMTTQKNDIYNSENRISKDFKSFIPDLGAKFSRMGPDIYMYEAVLANDNNHAAVIYSVHAPYRDYPSYILATYTASGKLISETTFAHRSYDQLIVGNIDAQKHITIKTYEFGYEDEGVQYEKPVPADKLKLKNVATLKVAKSGKVEDTSTAYVD